MKAIFYLLHSLVLVSACNAVVSTDNAPSFLPGIYTATGKGPFSEASDTLIISAYDAKACTYLITRKTGYHRLVNGAQLPREHTTHQMLMVYNKTNHQLKEEKTGRVFSFAEGKKQLLFGTAVYIKINKP